MKQKTLGRSVSIQGKGLHSGKSVTMTLMPAPEGHGFKFQRKDLEGEPIIPADVQYVTDTVRGTTLTQGTASVSVVEHTLSALIGMDLDNVLIQVDGPELPILDGSALPIVELVETAGVVAQEADRDYFILSEPITQRNELNGSELMALPSSGEFQVTTMIDFNSPVLGQQYADLQNINEYKSQIAPCRTFVFLHELESLVDMNLIKGGDLENAVVIADRKIGSVDMERLSHKLGRTGMEVDKEGVLNTTDLKFKNEPARHKLLDVIGDLALAGVRIKGKVVATKPGHQINVEFAKQIKKAWKEQQKLVSVPKYDLNAAPIYGYEDIVKLLPHRYPFLFVDKVMEISDKHIIGIKNITFNEQFFQGHFPNNPIFPGVLQIEAMAQVGGIFALHSQEEGQWDTYFLKIDNCKFKQKVKPGDTLVMRCELVTPIRRGIVQMQGTAYVGNQLVSEAELTAQIIKRTA